VRSGEALIIRTGWAASNLRKKESQLRSVASAVAVLDAWTLGRILAPGSFARRRPRGWPVLRVASERREQVLEHDPDLFPDRTDQPWLCDCTGHGHHRARCPRLRCYPTRKLLSPTFNFCTRTARRHSTGNHTRRQLVAPTGSGWGGQPRIFSSQRSTRLDRYYHRALTPTGPSAGG